MSLRIRHNACPACGGDLHPLGALGNTVHYRCRHCGIQTSRTKRTRKPKVKEVSNEIVSGWHAHIRSIKEDASK